MFIHYPKGSLFFVQRDEANKLFLIQDGIVKTSIITEQGEERIIELENNLSINVLV